MIHLYSRLLLTIFHFVARMDKICKLSGKIIFLLFVLRLQMSFEQVGDWFPHRSDRVAVCYILSHDQLRFYAKCT